MNDTGEARFVTGSLWRHVVVMSLTSSVGLMAIFAVDLADMIFIGMLGNAALAAAVGYAGTLLFFTNSINIGLSIAAGALVARATGSGSEDDARRYATSIAIFGSLTGVVIPMIVIPHLPSLLGALGASGDVLDRATGYCRIVLPSMPLMSLAMNSMAVMRARGDAARPMWVTLSGGAVNAALDPLLIFGFGLGLEGAGIATLVARIVLAVFSVAQGIRRHNAFCWPSVKAFRQDVLPISQLAVPAVMTNAATPVGAALMTRIMASYGTDAVAGMAIIARLTPVAFGVTLALSGAIGPIIGQNAGAGRTDRLRAALIAALQFTALYVVGAAAVLFALRGPISGAFGAVGETRELLFLFCGPLALFMVFNGTIYVANASLNNLGRPLQSTAVNWGRNTIGTVPLALAGGTLMGADGALIGQAMGGLLFSFVAVRLAMRAIESPQKPGAFAHHRQSHRMLARFGL